MTRLVVLAAGRVQRGFQHFLSQIPEKPTSYLYFAGSDEWDLFRHATSKDVAPWRVVAPDSINLIEVGQWPHTGSFLCCLDKRSRVNLPEYTHVMLQPLYNRRILVVAPDAEKFDLDDRGLLAVVQIRLKEWPLFTLPQSIQAVEALVKELPVSRRRK